VAVLLLLFFLTIDWDISSRKLPVTNVKKTALQLLVLSLGVAAFALLLDRVIDLNWELPVDGPVVAPDPFAPANVRAALTATRNNWVMVSPYEGRDNLHFATLMTFRCGLQMVRYGLNAAPAETVWPMEPCHSGTAVPNAMQDMEHFPLYVSLPPGAVKHVSVELTYLDGTVELMRYARAEILQP
jgi:hypothetical protein